jgi:ABC-type Mn2+/Zn2+ transport system permease subunit
MIDSLADFIHYDFLWLALIGSILLALTTGLLSPLVIAKRQAFMGAAVGHSTLLGLAIGLALFGPDRALPLYFTTLITTLLLTLFLAARQERGKLPEDSAIGIFYSVSMGLGIIVHTLLSGGKGDLMGYLFGNILLLSNTDIVIAAILLIVTSAIIFSRLDSWIFTTFDEEGALLAKIPVRAYRFTFYLLQALVIVSGLKIAGAVLVQTLLLVPGHFALKTAKSTRQTLVYAVGFSAITCVFGLVLANALSLPSGPTLAVFQFLALGLTHFAAKMRKTVRSA